MSAAVRRLPAWIGRGHQPPSDAVRGASRARVGSAVDDLKADVQNKVKDHIKQYVIEHSSRGDSTTASYREVWDSIASAAGMNADQVNKLLTDSGAWGSLTLTEKSLLGGSSAKLAEAVVSDMNGGDGSGLITWDQFVKAAGIPPLAGDAAPSGSKSKDTLTPEDRKLAECVLPGHADDPGCHPDPTREAPGTPKGGKFSGMHVADRFRSAASPQAVKIAPKPGAPEAGISTTAEVAAFGVPTVAGALAAIVWGWRAFAIGGAVGVVAAAGVYAWSRITS